MHTLGNKDGKTHNGTFHQGLHCLLKQQKFSEREIQFQLEIITCYPSICTVDHHKFILLNQQEESIST